MDSKGEIKGNYTSGDKMTIKHSITACNYLSCSETVVITINYRSNIYLRKIVEICNEIILFPGLPTVKEGEVNSREVVGSCNGREGKTDVFCPIVDNPKWEIEDQICGNK